jgi:ABC-type thiamine transport system ATPase subunit
MVAPNNLAGLAKASAALAVAAVVMKERRPILLLDELVSFEFISG